VTWAIILLILLVAFGPVLWLVPSRKDKRLASLRARARAEGLLVELRRIPKPDPAPTERVSAGGKALQPAIECASYAHPLNRSLTWLPGFRIVRRASEGAPDPLPGWSYDIRPKGDGRRYLDRMLPLVDELVKVLPGDVAALEIERRTVLVYWLEKAGSEPETVSEMALNLRSFGLSLTALEDAISAEQDTGDS
jgi:hypothetical protein